MREFEIAKKYSEVTSYLQFQISESHEKIETIEDKIAVFKDDRVFGSKLRQLENSLEYWKGRRDTLQEIWNFRNKGMI